MCTRSVNCAGHLALRSWLLPYEEVIVHACIVLHSRVLICAALRQLAAKQFHRTKAAFVCILFIWHLFCLILISLSIELKSLH